MNAQALTSASFQYALRRVAVFPLAPGTKIPIKGSRGCRDATTDSDVTRARWQRTPQANIGAATGSKSGFWVFTSDKIVLSLPNTASQATVFI